MELHNCRKRGFGKDLCSEVDHQALLDPANKPCRMGWISKWLLILLDLDLTLVFWLEKKCVIANHMSKITSGEPLVGIDDDIPDVTLFSYYYVPKWSAWTLWNT